MIGLVLVAHGTLAGALADALVHVVGPLERLRVIAIGPNDSLQTRRADIDKAVAEVDNGTGVAVITDMFGGTPSNLAHVAMKRPNVEVIYGANLPMLVKLAKMRDQPLGEAVSASIEAGRKYINAAGCILDNATQGR